MAKNVVISGVTYPSVPYVEVPIAGSTSLARFVDTDSGDAVAGDIRGGKKAWVDGNEITGSLPVKGQGDVTVSGKNVTIPAGLYDASVSKSVADGVVTPGATVSGDEIGTAVTDYEVLVSPSATVSSGYVSGNKTGSTITRYIQVEDRTASPGTAAVVVTPTAGKLIKKVTVSAVDVSATATESDVLAGKTFYSGSLTRRTGTAQVPVVSQDSATKVLSIR